MKRVLSALCFLLGACAHAQPADLAIRGATVIDVTDGSLRPNQTVLVEGLRIVAVGPADEIVVPNHAEVVDAAGKY
ncbi:MAG TPA: hypothetical protein VE173_05310, partial [Longimicrobiales bacterium]|nr:hypothetical protein [Longimicrobiales bacterium]